MAVGFGLVALTEGGGVLFGGEAARRRGGEAARSAVDYVPFVLWFNFLDGFAYLGAGRRLRAVWAMISYVAWRSKNRLTGP